MLNKHESRANVLKKAHSHKVEQTSRLKKKEILGKQVRSGTLLRKSEDFYALDGWIPPWMNE